jgi:DNA-directed RNA polymerase specialized sigma24 family protein
MDTGVAAESETLHASFEDAYVSFRDPLFHYLRRFAVDDDEAADRTAKTFERAFVKLPSYRGGPHHLAAWLFRIARSQAVDATRRRRPHRPRGPRGRVVVFSQLSHFVSSRRPTPSP